MTNEHHLADEISVSLIPAIEYLHFGEVDGLREEFRIKLNKALASTPIFADHLTAIIKYIYIQTDFSFILFSQGIS